MTLDSKRVDVVAMEEMLTYMKQKSDSTKEDKAITRLIQDVVNHYGNPKSEGVLLSLSKEKYLQIANKLF